MRHIGWTVLALGIAATGGCRGGSPRASAAGPAGTLVIAAVSEPQSLLPPLAVQTVERDIGDLVFERLATLAPGAPPIDTAAYRPGLADRWERVDSLTWRFHLRPGARWQDGAPVRAEDVVFSFGAFADSILDSPARPAIAGKITATAADSATVLVHFTSNYPEQLYDATWLVRVIPRHIWDTIPRSRWTADTALSHLVGSGPYRLAAWRRGESLTLVADSAPAPARRPGIARVVWRFAADPEAALNLVLSHAADLMETVGAPDRVARVRADSAYRIVKYPSAVYGFAGFRLADAAGRPHPVLGDRRVRQALALATDRGSLARAIVGPDSKAPAGPMSDLLWIADAGITALPFDTARAGALLDTAGWRRGPDGLRRRSGRPLAFDLLVPSTSSVRRQLALALQEAWRRIGATVTVTAVDFPVFQERLGKGRFDAYIGAYLDEPSPRGLAEQWTRAGWGGLNYGRYDDPAVDSLLSRAGKAAVPAQARALYVAALDSMNVDVPAIWLYTPVNAAAAARRIGNLSLDPYEWLSTLPEWTVR